MTTRTGFSPDVPLSADELRYVANETERLGRTSIQQVYTEAGGALQTGPNGGAAGGEQNQEPVVPCKLLKKVK